MVPRKGKLSDTLSHFKNDRVLTFSVWHSFHCCCCCFHSSPRVSEAVIMNRVFFMKMEYCVVKCKKWKQWNKQHFDGGVFVFCLMLASDVISYNHHQFRVVAHSRCILRCIVANFGTRISCLLCIFCSTFGLFPSLFSDAFFSLHISFPSTLLYMFCGALVAVLLLLLHLFFRSTLKSVFFTFFSLFVIASSLLALPLWMLCYIFQRTQSFVIFLHTILPLACMCRMLHSRIFMICMLSYLCTWKKMFKCTK